VPCYLRFNIREVNRQIGGFRLEQKDKSEYSCASPQVDDTVTILKLRFNLHEYAVIDVGSGVDVPPVQYPNIFCFSC
jgi:hypothetical protein